MQERQIVADACAKSLKIAFPILLDNLDDVVERAYAGWPDRLYVVDADGKIAQKGAPGPGGFKPSVDLLPSVLDRLLDPTTAQTIPPMPNPSFAQMMPRMKEQLGMQMQRMGLSEPERIATLEMWEQKFTAFSQVAQARQELMMSLRQQTNADETAKLLAAYQEATKKYVTRVDELDKSLEAKIEFSKKPTVQAFLTAMGVLGVNFAAPMMGGGPGSQRQ